MIYMEMGFLKKGFHSGVLFAAALLPARLFADGAAVILSGDLSSYKEAAVGFRGNFDRPFKEYILSPSEADQKKLVESVHSQSPKIIIAIGSKAAVEAHSSFPQIPLIYCMVVNPERQGLLDKKNVFGVSFTINESVLFSKYKTVLPNLKRLGVITDEKKNNAWIDKISQAARDSGIEIMLEQINESSDIPSAMRALSGKIDAFWMTTDPVMTNKFAFNTALDFCISSKIPLLVPVESLVNAGGFLSVTVSENSIGAEVAALSKNILDGSMPQYSLVQLSKTNLSVSLKAAKKIGIEIPDAMLKIVNQIP